MYFFTCKLIIIIINNNFNLIIMNKLYSKGLYHVVIEDIIFNFEDYALQSYVPEIGFLRPGPPYWIYEGRSISP